eukprot:scaffold56689_cov60-Phaeocystis_antarctica.AAC.3
MSATVMPAPRPAVYSSATSKSKPLGAGPRYPGEWVRGWVSRWVSRWHAPEISLACESVADRLQRSALVVRGGGNRHRGMHGCQVGDLHAGVVVELVAQRGTVAIGGVDFEEQMKWVARHTRLELAAAVVIREDGLGVEVEATDGEDRVLLGRGASQELWTDRRLVAVVHELDDHLVLELGAVVPHGVARLDEVRRGRCTTIGAVAGRCWARHRCGADAVQHAEGGEPLEKKGAADLG